MPPLFLFQSGSWRATLRVSPDSGSVPESALLSTPCNADKLRSCVPCTEVKRGLRSCVLPFVQVARSNPTGLVKEKSWNHGKTYHGQRAHLGPATLPPRQEGGREQQHSHSRTVRSERKARGYGSSKCVHCRITFTIAFFSKSFRKTALAGRIGKVDLLKNSHGSCA